MALVSGGCQVWHGPSRGIGRGTKQLVAICRHIRSCYSNDHVLLFSTHGMNDCSLKPLPMVFPVVRPAVRQRP